MHVGGNRAAPVRSRRGVWREGTRRRALLSDESRRASLQFLAGDLTVYSSQKETFPTAM